LCGAFQGLRPERAALRGRCLRWGPWRGGTAYLAEGIKEKELLEALVWRGKQTAVEAALETSLSVEEADLMLCELAVRGHLEVSLEQAGVLLLGARRSPMRDVGHQQAS
jgi:hypothetical protein